MLPTNPIAIHGQPKHTSPQVRHYSCLPPPHSPLPHPDHICCLLQLPSAVATKPASDGRWDNLLRGIRRKLAKSSCRGIDVAGGIDVAAGDVESCGEEAGQGHAFPDDRSVLMGKNSTHGGAGSPPRGSGNASMKFVLTPEDMAAVRIQAAYRGHLARRAFHALKGLVKLQALVRGFCVRRQVRAAMQCMQALVRLQVRVRTRQLLGRTPRDAQTITYSDQ